LRFSRRRYGGRLQALVSPDYTTAWQKG